MVARFEKPGHTPQGGGLAVITAASGNKTVLTKEPVNGEAWSPDGRAILRRDFDGGRLSLVSLVEGSPIQTVITEKYRIISARISPDRKYLVYSSSEAGAREVYVASFPSFGVKRRVSTSGGSYPYGCGTARRFFTAESTGF